MLLLAFDVATKVERLGCLAVEHLEDGQALVNSRIITEHQEQGMMPLLDLGQRVDPGIVQQVLGDIGMEVPAGMVQRFAPLWQGAAQVCDYCENDAR